MWRPPSSICRAWAMGMESIVSFELLIVLESSMEQPYPFSLKDHLHRPRRAPLGPNHDCTKTSADQTSPRARSWTSWMDGWSRVQPWRTKENGLDKCRSRKRRGKHSTEGCEKSRGGVAGDPGNDCRTSSLALSGKSVG
jgi:hypothetical protein